MALEEKPRVIYGGVYDTKTTTFAKPLWSGKVMSSHKIKVNL